MSLSVLYTLRSKQTLKSTYAFIENKFGLNSANKFISKAEKTIKLIATQPFMFKASGIDENVRVGFITKQCSLFYRVTDTSIHLLFFWDNRQEPVLPRL
jgi:plasmid stabilization system protein ParE